MGTVVTYGVGRSESVGASARRPEASLMRVSRSLSFGMTCRETMMFSNSFYTRSLVGSIKIRTFPLFFPEIKLTSHFSPSF